MLWLLTAGFGILSGYLLAVYVRQVRDRRREHDRLKQLGYDRPFAGTAGTTSLAERLRWYIIP